MRMLCYALREVPVVKATTPHACRDEASDITADASPMEEEDDRRGHFFFLQGVFGHSVPHSQHAESEEHGNFSRSACQTGNTPVAVDDEVPLVIVAMHVVQHAARAQRNPGTNQAGRPQQSPAQHEDATQERLALHAAGAQINTAHMLPVPGKNAAQAPESQGRARITCAAVSRPTCACVARIPMESRATAERW